MKHEPLVSIIMNCYNGEKYLKEAIDSVYAQTYQKWEIIFWDNASTDGTAKIAAAYDERLKYYRAEVNTPLGPARNKALEKAMAPYISFLDSDDVYLPYALQRQVELMEADDYGLVYGGTIVIDENGKEIEQRRLKHSSGFMFDSLLRSYDIAMCSVMVRRLVINKEGLMFGENLEYCPDYNLFMKVAAQYPLGVIREPIVKYRRSPNSLSRKTLHLVPKEVGFTLDELQELYPDVMSSLSDAMSVARSKLNFYSAISCISQGDNAAARSALKPVLGSRWEFLALYLVLFLPVSKSWLLRILKR